MFVNEKQQGKEWRAILSSVFFLFARRKKKALMATASALMMCHKAPIRGRNPRFLLCEIQTYLQQPPLSHPRWPQEWTFEKQSLESVSSNGFIKEVITEQRGGAVNGRSNDAFHGPDLNKSSSFRTIQKFGIFPKRKRAFPPFFFFHLH